MRKFAVGVIALSAMFALAGCAGNTDVNPTSTIDPALIPQSPPANVVTVDAANFDDGFGDKIFKVGEGPTWCTISGAWGEDPASVTCEQDEASVQYGAIPAPADCNASYGYQIRLWAGKDAVTAGNHKQAQFTCATSSYSDPSDAKVLENGQQITVGDITCFVVDVTARCDNKNKNFIVLGPQAWALG